MSRSGAAFALACLLAGCTPTPAPSASSSTATSAVASATRASAAIVSASAAPLPRAAATTREARCQEAARACGARFVAGEDAAIVDCMPPEGLRASGGRAAVLKELESGKAEMAKHGVRIEGSEIDAPHDFVAVDDHVFAIVPQRTTIKVPEGHLLQRGYLLGVSTDGGDTWRFLDGAGLSRDRLKKLFTHFPDSFPLPEIQEPELVH